jgi:UDP-GlcNAc:undecaprenyl-phosphate GlcNAc-1-phosphate transferase
MHPGIASYLIVLAVAAVATYAATPLVRKLSERMGALKRPDERGVHVTPTPTLGGMAMLVGVLAAAIAAWAIDDFAIVFEARTEFIGVILAATFMYLVGFIDDLWEVSAPAKLAGMVLAGSILSLSGVSIFIFRIPFQGLFLLSGDLSFLVTVIWVVVMANASNLIDGLDGLAAGIMAIAAAAFFLYSSRLADADLLLAGNPGPLIAVIVFGICLGFLPHNFHPANIFMGDGGALLLGLLMAASTISVGGRTDDPFSGQAFFFFAPLIIPLFILGVPLVDIALAIFRRASRRTGFATADKEHLHHQLMRLGHGQRRSVLILWTWTALLSGFVLYPTFTGDGDGIVPIGIAALLLVLFTLFAPGVDRLRDAWAERRRM